MLFPVSLQAACDAERKKGLASALSASDSEAEVPEVTFLPRHQSHSEGSGFTPSPFTISPEHLDIAAEVSTCSALRRRAETAEAEVAMLRRHLEAQQATVAQLTAQLEAANRKAEQVRDTVTDIFTHQLRAQRQQTQATLQHVVHRSVDAMMRRVLQARRQEAFFKWMAFRWLRVATQAVRGRAEEANRRAPAIEMGSLGLASLQRSTTPGSWQRSSGSSATVSPSFSSSASARSSSVGEYPLTHSSYYSAEGDEARYHKAAMMYSERILMERRC
eukprot:Sspe_Gene.93548::Locus_66152_Transcript_9_10_Confidence_0.214_Length_3434::g.93548::m.93548